MTTIKREGNHDIYEFNDDTIANFDVLNDKYRNTYDWIINENSEDTKIQENLVIDGEGIDPLEVFKILEAPDQKNDNSVSISSKYISKKSNPFERLVALKHELANCKLEMDEYAELFKENTFIKSTKNFANVHDEINLYKAKVDAFIDYSIFNSLKDDGQDQDGEDTSKQSIDESKKKYSSNYDKNNILINSIISQVKEIQENLYNQLVQEGTNGEAKDPETRTVNYEICSTYENQVNIISSKIGSLESDVNKLEKIIGEWSLYDNNESICSVLNKLVNFTIAKSGEKYEKKFQTAKDCGNIINSFSDKKVEEIWMGSNFIKIKELYSILELSENFEQVFDYITKRFKAIKFIHDQSDQFNSMVDDLNKNTNKVEEKFKKLKESYSDISQELIKYHEILKNVELLEAEISKELLI